MDDAFPHHELSAIRDRSPRTISDTRTISKFLRPVNRHSPQIQTSFFTWSAMKNLPDLQYPPHSFLPHAPRKQQKAAAHAHNTCSAAILSYLLYMYSHPAHARTSYLSFEARATSPLSARSARTFGMTISPLKKSAKDHTSSSFRQEPITMQTTTIRE